MTVRRAVPDDAAELTRLRAVMLESGDPDSWPDRVAADPQWEHRCRRELTDRLAGPDLAAFVVESPDGAGLVACAIGDLDRRVPAPGRGEITGHVGSVVTDPAHRRRGYARAAVSALLAWFDAEGIERLDLNATAQAETLYRQLGFTESRTALRRTTPHRHPEEE